MVQTGITHMANKWNKAEFMNNSNLQQQKVMRAKLKKVQAFLDGLRGGSTYERDHRPMVNVDVEEDRLQDIQTEVETIIQMTYVKPNYDD